MFIKFIINLLLLLNISLLSFIVFKRIYIKNFKYNNLLDNTSEKLSIKDFNPKYIYNEPPERKNNNYTFRINERTRGEPDNYNLIGMLYNIDENKNYNLYGRHIYPGSYEWEYYVEGADAGGLKFKYPLDISEEILDNTEIQLPFSSDPFIVTIYNYDEYKYIPYI